MSNQITLDTQLREKYGKGAARAARRSGRIPAVIYGDKKPPVMITIAERQLVKYSNSRSFLSSVITLKVDGKEQRVLPRAVQTHPVTDRAEHVDFLRLSADARVAVAIPVRFIDELESPGLKRGGVLNVIRHEIELSCSPDMIPADVVISLKGKEILDSIHISQVTLPEGVESVIKDRDFTIATVVAPSSLRSEAEEEAKTDESEEEGEEEEKTEDKDS